MYDKYIWLINEYQKQVSELKEIVATSLREMRHNCPRNEPEGGFIL